MAGWLLGVSPVRNQTNNLAISWSHDPRPGGIYPPWIHPPPWSKPNTAGLGTRRLTGPGLCTPVRLPPAPGPAFQLLTLPTSWESSVSPDYTPRLPQIALYLSWSSRARRIGPGIVNNCKHIDIATAYHSTIPFLAGGCTFSFLVSPDLAHSRAWSRPVKLSPYNIKQLAAQSSMCSTACMLACLPVSISRDWMLLAGRFAILFEACVDWSCAWRTWCGDDRWRDDSILFYMTLEFILPDSALVVVFFY
jgi:hypothetical protein